jgi:CRISPR/Cas system-associated protein Cas10 (large subunit of type III CRISPR-Cas system)
MSNNQKRSKSKRESQKFRDILSELGYETIGDFIELAGGMVSMLIQNQEEKDLVKKDNVNVMGEQFVYQTGIIIERIGHLDKLMQRNEELKKAAEEAKEKAQKIAEGKQKQADAPTLYAPDGSILK